MKTETRSIVAWPAVPRPWWAQAVRQSLARLSAVAAILGAASLAHAAELHVPADFPTIQQAIDAAQDGDTVIVAPGTYNEAINFSGKQITVRSAAPGNADETIIDATGLSASAVAFESGEGPQSVLDGLTLTGGEGTFFGPQRYGGGIIASNFSSPTIINCIIRDNTAHYGGAIANLNFSSPLLVNCLLVSNSAEFAGGGGAHFNDSNPTYVNCTFVNNTASFGGGAVDIATFCHPNLHNCIVWGNAPSQFGGFPHVTDSIVQGGYPGGSNIINADPLFADPAAGDYSVSAGSPAIDVGVNAHLPSVPGAEFDLAGNPRIVDGTGDGNAIIDIGAYEFQPDIIPCPGDLTGNGSVGVPDLLVLLSCWGPVDPGSACEAADLTGSGAVGVADLLELLSLWGPCR